MQIDLNEERRKNTGFFAKLLEKPITVLKEEWMYKPLDKETVNLIKNQTTQMPQLSYDPGNLFSEDVEIVVRGDKKYYLAK